MRDVLIKLAQTGKLFLSIALGFATIWGFDWKLDPDKWVAALDLLIALLSSIVMFFSGALTFKKMRKSKR